MDDKTPQYASEIRVTIFQNDEVSVPPVESLKLKEENTPSEGNLQMAATDASTSKESERKRKSEGAISRRSLSPHDTQHHPRRRSGVSMEEKFLAAVEDVKKSVNEWTSIEQLPSRISHWKMDPSVVRHKGGCHCGAVRFEVFASPTPTVIECNCSICVKKQNRHFIVPMANFKLLQGHDSLKTYSFNTHKAKHSFCSVCGVQSFYIPRSNSDGYGIMPHCLDAGTLKKEKVEKFDGKKWEEEIKKKAHVISYSKAKV